MRSISTSPAEKRCKLDDNIMGIQQRAHCTSGPSAIGSVISGRARGSTATHPLPEGHMDPKRFTYFALRVG
jgi:hypothetical protein